jgi:hypothetical protein
MRLLLIVFGVIIVALATYYLLFPRNSFFIFPRSGGSAVTFSRTSLSFDSAPDHYATNGFDHIQPYVSRLLTPSKRLRFVSMFTPDGQRGFGLSAEGTTVAADLTVEWREEPKQEAAIRSFFASLGARPSQDYLAANGGVPEKTRVLSYPLRGDVTELTAVTKRILKELCSVSAREALNIKYSEK